VTYPDLCVTASLNEYYIPVQVNVDKDKEMVKKFGVVWTPNINVLDASENLFYHIEGWLPPSEYTAMLMVAHGQYFLRQKRYEKAKEVFQKVWKNFSIS